MLSKNVCVKCDGPMYLNTDSDLTCFICGSIIVLTVRRNADVTGIRKKSQPKDTKGRMSSNGMQRKKGAPRKFLGR